MILCCVRYIALLFLSAPIQSPYNLISKQIDYKRFRMQQDRYPPIMGSSQYRNPEKPDNYDVIYENKIKEFEKFSLSVAQIRIPFFRSTLSKYASKQIHHDVDPARVVRHFRQSKNILKTQTFEMGYREEMALLLRGNTLLGYFQILLLKINKFYLNLGNSALIKKIEDWKYISSIIPGTTPKVCELKIQQLKTKPAQELSWTVGQQQLLKFAVKDYISKTNKKRLNKSDWSSVAKYLQFNGNFAFPQLRSHSSCKKRWEKYVEFYQLAQKASQMEQRSGDQSDIYEEESVPLQRQWIIENDENRLETLTNYIDLEALKPFEVIKKKIKWKKCKKDQVEKAWNKEEVKEKLSQNFNQQQKVKGIQKQKEKEIEIEILDEKDQENENENEKGNEKEKEKETVKEPNKNQKQKRQKKKKDQNGQKKQKEQKKERKKKQQKKQKKQEKQKKQKQQKKQQKQKKEDEEHNKLEAEDIRECLRKECKQEQQIQQEIPNRKKVIQITPEEFLRRMRKQINFDFLFFEFQQNQLQPIQEAQQMQVQPNKDTCVQKQNVSLFQEKNQSKIQTMKAEAAQPEQKIQIMNMLSEKNQFVYIEPKIEDREMRDVKQKDGQMREDIIPFQKKQVNLQDRYISQMIEEMDQKALGGNNIHIDNQEVKLELIKAVQIDPGKRKRRQKKQPSIKIQSSAIGKSQDIVQKEISNHMPSRMEQENQNQGLKNENLGEKVKMEGKIFPQQLSQRREILQTGRDLLNGNKESSVKRQVRNSDLQLQVQREKQINQRQLHHPGPQIKINELPIGQSLVPPQRQQKVCKQQIQINMEDNFQGGRNQAIVVGQQNEPNLQTLHPNPYPYYNWQNYPQEWQAYYQNYYANYENYCRSHQNYYLNHPHGYYSSPSQANYYASYMNYMNYYYRNYGRVCKRRIRRTQ